MTQKQTALILGATGGIGGEVAAALGRRGWRINALHRNPTQAAARGHSAPAASASVAPTEINWIAGDAMNAADVINAARGASLIVHAVNPPGYRNWSTLVLPMLDNTISAARSSGARILLPGTVYNYGPDEFPIVREDSPQNPRTRKGAIRAKMERRLRTAADSGVRSIVVRAGDFFGPAATGNNWFSGGLVKPGRRVTSILYPGRRGVGHAWAYLPDLAEAMSELVGRESLGAFETFHFAGHWDADGTQMIEAIRAAAGNPHIPARRFPWPIVTLLTPFVRLFREMHEMRYLWREPVRLSNDRLVKTLGAEPRTSLEQAVRTTLSGLGCV